MLTPLLRRLAVQWRLSSHTLYEGVDTVVAPKGSLKDRPNTYTPRATAICQGKTVFPHKLCENRNMFRMFPVSLFQNFNRPSSLN